MLVSEKNYEKAVEVAAQTANSTTVGDPQENLELGLLRTNLSMKRSLE